jgi:DNA ligase-associated metallophosphoesterase
MALPLRHIIHNNTFWLSPHRYIFWEEQQALILSDLHLGKTGHFRKAGIGVPQSVYKEDLQRLFTAIGQHKPKQVIFVGDLFHSTENKELDWFLRWRNDLGAMPLHLVRGNHDILTKEWYAAAAITVHEELTINGIHFIHDVTAGTPPPANEYVFTGHLHPGICISGMGKQSLRFPCFYFSEQYAILPAFSHFTGLALVQPERTDAVFAIVNQSVIALHKNQA